MLNASEAGIVSFNILEKQKNKANGDHRKRTEEN
jgi:hypothetical protein